jgi:hypothetical protein
VNPQPVLAGMFDERPPRQHKRSRQTSRQVYRELRESLEGREGQVLRLLAWHWNERQTSPTALELLKWAREKGESLFDVNSIRPRLRALFERGAVAPRAKRTCAVSGKTVWTWAVREIGDQEPR